MTVPVKELAEWIGVTATRVQQLEKKGIVVKVSRGIYRLKESVQGYIREMSSKADGKHSEYHQERTKKMKIDRMEAERDFAERMGQLVPAESVRKEIERLKAEERQAILNMPKNMAPRLEGLSLVEMELALNDWAEKFLSSAANGEFGKGAQSEFGKTL